MLVDLGRVNAAQQAMVLDDSPHVAARCPRRAGKSYAGAAAALITGESKPGSISIIISLNLKQLRRLYWAGGPSGLWTLNRKYGLNLDFNNSMLRWEHENGSIGYLCGADDEDQIEVLRGLEADLYLVDECKSFAPGRLQVLIDDIIDPQRGSRDGKLILMGTPGHISAGPFYEATCLEARDTDKKPFAIRQGTKDAFGRTPKDDLLWSLHEWSLADNSSEPGKRSWKAALVKKRAKKWADDHPTWLREYLGQWTSSHDGMVFRYYAEKSTGRVTWTPKPTADNPAGLPREGVPWRFVAGLDIGYEAPTALVVGAYSQKLGQLRHVEDVSRTHLLVPDLADLIHEMQDKYGVFEKIFADMGNLGTMIVRTLVEQHGFPLEKADKREKYDFIELLNGGFSRGEVLIIEADVARSLGHTTSQLEEQLITSAWDLGKFEDASDPAKKLQLARLGRLREDKNVPNDSSDAFVYLYRGSLHHFGLDKTVDQPAFGTPEWDKKRQVDELATYREKLRRADAAKGKFAGSMTANAPSFVKAALRHGSRPAPRAHHDFKGRRSA